MKRLFTHLALLIALLLVGISPTWAQTTYELKVGGVTVTSANASNITGSTIKSGKVSYDAAEKRLIIDNAVIETSGITDGIYNSGIDGLIIRFVGKCSITTNSSGSNVAGIYCSKNTTFTSMQGAAPPQLTISNTGSGPAIKSYGGANIDIYYLHVTASASNMEAVYAASAARMSLHYLRLSASAPSGKAALTGFTSGLAMDMVCFESSTLSFNASAGAVYKSGSKANTFVIIPSLTLGNQYIGSGQSISKASTGASSFSGTVSYNASTKTLTLNNAVIDGARLDSYVDGLTIETTGTSSIKSYQTTFLVRANTTFTGSGALTLESTNGSAISTYNNAAVTINMDQLIAKGAEYGFYGQAEGELTLKKATSTTSYRFVGVLCNFFAGKLTMNDVDIWTPRTYHDAATHKMMYNGAVATSSNGPASGTWFNGKNQFTYYNLYVGGTQVNHRNAEAIYSPYLTSGSVSYNSGTKTLTLNNATISGQTGTTSSDLTKSPIYSYIDNLVINTVGTNSLTTADNVVVLGGSTKVTGSGTFNLKSTSKSAINIYGSGALTLERSGGEMTMEGKQYGYYGVPSTALTINKSGSNGGLYKFMGEQGNISNTLFAMGSGVQIHSKYTWYNQQAKAVYLRNEQARGSDQMTSGTWIRGDVAWTQYPILINGTRLYGCTIGGELKGNANGYWDQYVKAGEITYNSSSKQLNISGANIDVNADLACVWSEVDNLTIYFVGTNKMQKTGTANNAILLKSSATIRGTGSSTLDITAPYAVKLLSSTASLTFDDIKLTTNGTVSGYGGDPTLSVKYSTIDCGGLKDFSSLAVTPAEAGFAIPNGGVYTSAGMQRNDQAYTGRVLIRPLESYGVYVAGIEANSYNADNIFADPMYEDSYGKQGTATYMASGRMLKLSGVNITAPSGIDAVKIASDGKSVEFTGNNTLSAIGDGNAIWAANGGTLIGATASAVLNASNTSDNYPAIYCGSNGGASSKNLEIRNLIVNANGIGAVSSDNKLIIDGAEVNLSGHAKGSVRGFGAQELQGGVIVMEPSGATYDEGNRYLAGSNGSRITGAVKYAMGDDYPIWIAGTQVNSGNATNVMGDGKVSYDNATKTLTLNGASIGTGSGEHMLPIYSEASGLTIDVKGATTIDGGNYPAIQATANTTITGTAPLTAKGGVSVTNHANLTITDADVSIEGRLRGTYVGSGSELVITNSKVTITNSSGFATISEWGAMQLDGCAVTAPSGAVFSSSDGKLFVGSNQVTGDVTIEPVVDYGITIAGIPIHDKNAADISGTVGANGQMTVTRNGGKTTITMNGFWFTGTDEYMENIICIDDRAGDVTINLIGENVVNSSRPDIDGLIKFDNFESHSHVITGSGSLKSNAEYGIHGEQNYSSLRIDGTNLDIVMLYYINNLEFAGSNVSLAGDEMYGTIEDVNNVTLTGCDFTAPTGAYFDTSAHAVYAGSDRVMGQIEISAMKKFGITIAGIPVSDVNASAITGEGITGNVSWNAGTGRLRLDNAAIDGGAEPAIAIDGNAIGNVQIELVGNNKLESNVNGIAVSGTCNVGISSVDGTGLLRINAGLNGIDGANRLAIANATADIVGDQIGVRGGTLDIQGGAIVGITAVSGTQALTDMVGIDLATNMIVATGAADAQMVAFGEDYGFSINGQRVTSYAVALDENDLYDPASKTLTINNVNLPTYIDNEKCAGLTFKVSGANTFVGGDKPVIRTQQPIVIDGTGTLTLTSDVTAIDATADVTIKGGVAVSVSGTTAIDGHNTSTLHIDNSVVTLSGSDQVVKDLAALDLTGVSISEPANAVFADGTVKVDGTPVSAASVIIGDVKSYGIDVAGIDITTVNAGSVESTDITKGTVSYDDGTKTLTLNNVDIAGTVTIADEVADIINIQLIGDNTVTTSDAKAFYTKNGGFRFFSDGTGSLAITASGLGSTAVTAEKAITFDNCLVIADGGERGFSGVTMNCVVTIDNAAVRVKGSQSCVAGMKNIVLAGGVVANPTADGNKAIKVNDFGSKIEYASSGDVVRDTWVDLSESYDMWIGSTLLTRAVAYKGTTTIATGVSYNHSTRTLSLENTTIDGIWNAGSELNVVVDGECTINSSSYGTGTKKPAIYAGADVNIVANTTTSTLTLDGGNFSPAVLGEGEAKVSFGNHITTIAKGMRGIYSEDKQLTLEVNNATLMATGTQQSISGLKALVMTGCGITAPSGAAYNAATGAVELNGSAIVGQTVTIDPSGDGIDSIIATSDADVEAIYSVDGKKLHKSRSGVNIVRRTDGTVTKVLRK